MKHVPSCVLLVFVPLAAACGGGGSADAGVLSEGAGSLLAGFLPDEADPGAQTASMAQGSRSGDLVTVQVNVTGTPSQLPDEALRVYGAAFDVTYDSLKTAYVGWSAGELLEEGGHSPVYQVSATAGRVVVGASRNGGVAAVVVPGNPTALIHLTFRVLESGSARLEFDSPELFDGQNPPRPIPGVQWFAGSLGAQ